MKKIIVTKSNEHIFVEGALASGIGINISNDETVGEVDASSLSSEDWDELQKMGNKEVSKEVEKIKKKFPV